MGQPTMEDVARRAGVSRALVSLVMRGSPKVSEKRRSAVERAARELGYRPNVLARNLASTRTQTIGVLLNDLHNPFFAEAVDGILESADEASYHALLATGGPTRLGEARAVETFLRFRVDGLILAGPRLPTSRITEAAATCPTVLLGRAVRGKTVDSVNNDEGLGADLAVDHLVSLGHRRIAHIDGGDGAGAAGRRAGYGRAMKRAGLGAQSQIVDGDFTEAGGAAGSQALLEGRQRPSAIFAANDLSAAGAMAAAAELGFRVPEDLSVVGYDNTALAAIRHVSLTTIDQPREEMGRTAFRLLLERLDGGRGEAVRHIVAPSLVARTSTAPPSGHR